MTGSLTLTLRLPVRAVAFQLMTAKGIFRVIVAYAGPAQRIGHQAAARGEWTHQALVAGGWFVNREGMGIDDQLLFVAHDAPAGEEAEGIAGTQRGRPDTPGSAAGAIERNRPAYGRSNGRRLARSSSERLVEAPSTVLSRSTGSNASERVRSTVISGKGSGFSLASVTVQLDAIVGKCAMSRKRESRR